MHSAVTDMLSKYNCITADDYREALREIIQEVALLSLYRSNFFDRAYFYGGTALRIFYGLDRFPEDLDFSLVKSDPDFIQDSYLKYVISELSAFGFVVDVSKKTKSISTAFKSAFIKAGAEIDRAGVIGFLLNKFRTIDYIKAKSDIFPFIKEPKSVEIWSKEFFIAIT
jgi:hypothetical protein